MRNKSELEDYAAKQDPHFATRDIEELRGELVVLQMNLPAKYPKKNIRFCVAVFIQVSYRG